MVCDRVLMTQARTSSNDAAAGAAPAQDPAPSTAPESGAAGPPPAQPDTPPPQSEADARLADDDKRAEQNADAPLPEGSEWEKNRYGTKMGGPELEPLLAHTTPVRVSWLRELAERKGVVPPWQLLPPEAKVSLQELREAAKYRNYLPVAVLSYGWLAKGHPDPEGVLLQKLLPALKAMEKEGVIIGIVWDFVSLPQRGYTTGYDPERDDRTEYERKRFVRGLSAVNMWYRSAYVTE